MAIENLWGDFTPVEVTAPATILNEQATHLRRISNGVLEGFVRQLSGTGTTLNFEFRIRAPLLNDYEVMVIDVYHEIELYPAEVRDLINDRVVECDNEATFVKAVAAVLQSARLQQMVSALIAQSKAASG